MPIEQSSTPKEDRRTTSIRDSERTMARNQYQHYRTFTKIEWNECNSGHCRLVYEDDQTKGNNNEYIIRRNCKDLQRQNIEVTWNTQKDSQWQRTAIHIKIHGRIYQSARNQETIINSILSSNRWSNGENKLRNQNIPMALRELPARQLDGLVIGSRVPV